MAKVIKVGLDFDGVIVYNPLRLARLPITLVKRHVLGIKKLTFYLPKQKWQIFLWKQIHKSSVFPAQGIDDLKRMVKEGAVEAHLITARFDFLDDQLSEWLANHHLTELFKSINLNRKNEQPHLFKERMINKYKLDYFIEDNLNIVEYLDGKVKTKILWIWNIFDRWTIKYRKGYSFLGQALKQLSW